MAELIWHDGQLLSPDQAMCSCLDRGRLYGDGLFETMRAYSGTIFQLDAHLERLTAGAKQLYLRLPMSTEDLREAVQTPLVASGLSDAYVRLTVTRGVGGAPAELDASTASVTAWVRPLSGYPEQLYATGMSAVLASARRNECSPLSKLKTLNYLDSLLARAEAQRVGADEAMFLNTAGRLAETTASNLFLVDDKGCVLTPPVSAGILPGIARACVLALCAAEGIPFSEEPLDIHRLQEAQEAFLTNSLMEIMPLTRFEHRPIGSGDVGPLTEQLQEAYQRLVAEQTTAH